MNVITSRTRRLAAALTLCLILHVVSVTSQGAEPLPAKYRVYVGTFTTRGMSSSDGIYLFEFDPHTGTIVNEPRLVAECPDPSFLAIDRNAEHLYSVLAVSELDGQTGTGGVRAFQIDKATGDLTELNTQPTQGIGPCHVSLDGAGKTLLVTNYGAGATAATFPIQPDGSLGPAASIVKHTAAEEGKEPTRKPHGHSIHVSPDQKVAVVADAGLDVLKIYPFDPQTGKLNTDGAVSVPTLDKAAPRHLAFHPNGIFAYHNNEANFTATAHRYQNGVLTPIQTLPTVAQAGTFKGSTADLVVHPNGKLLYVSNRGPDSLAIYQIQSDGQLKPAGFSPTFGKIPRNFVIDSSGTFLLAANQESGTIVFFRINEETGALTATGEIVKVPKPVCVRLVPIGAK